MGLRYCGAHKASESVSCDIAARGCIQSLNAAMQRLGGELSDRGCQDPHLLLSQLLEEEIRYLVGPHYGWRGTIEECKVRVSKIGNEVRVCAEDGIRVEGGKRYVYRLRLPDLTEFETMTEDACVGKTYGQPEDPCFLSSMVFTTNGKCRCGKPLKWKRCKDVEPKEWQKKVLFRSRSAVSVQRDWMANPDNRTTKAARHEEE